MRISDWSSDVCSSDLIQQRTAQQRLAARQASATSTYRIWLAGLLGLLGVLAVIVSLLVSRGLVVPIRMLAEAARDIEAGRYRQVRFASPRDAEAGALIRSEELRVGKELVSTCRSSGRPSNIKKKK